MNAIYKELSDEAFINIALGGNYFKLAHLDEQLGEIVHQQWAHVCADPLQMHISLWICKDVG